VTPEADPENIIRKGKALEKELLLLNQVFLTVLIFLC
jgi:hypothetical protein